MTKIVVLGSNSFAGSQYVAHAIAMGHEVAGVNRSAEQNSIFLPYKNVANAGNYRFHQLHLNHDLERLFSLIEEFKPEIVVDFAGQGMVAESWQAPEQWYQTNIVSKVKLHHFLKDKEWLSKYIRISTPEVYGSSEQLIDESAVFNPSTPYAVSHAAIDMSLMAFYRQYDFPVVFTRFSNFYGPGQQLYRIIPRTIIYALTNRKLMLHGGGKAVRAFIYGSDVATAVSACIDKGACGESYHFSASKFVTIKELVEQIHRELNVDSDALVENTADRPGKDLRYLMNDNRAREELEWQPQVSLEEGISRSVKWVRQNLETIGSLSLNYEHKE